jgi:DNA polymerase I-like protein with 3'-5' exonuclease and polymerase domains
LNSEDLITPFGRRRRFYLITQQNKRDVLNEALSFLPQSTASDICLGAMTELRPMLRGHGFIRLTIHDALITECAEEKAEYVGGLMREVMLAKGKAFTDYVPFEVDLTVGKHWGQL